MHVDCSALLSAVAVLTSSSCASAFVVAPDAAGRSGGISPLGRSSMELSMSAALIVQNKGGGHGELEYQLAKRLLQDNSDKITSITLLQDYACKDDQEPFKLYASDLLHVKVIKAPFGNESMTKESLQLLLGDSTFVNTLSSIKL
jgi:hypothetical protein